jgi:tetratricopeptide (TPR) repeat protein/predicted Ser/Thr protein kinase
VVSAPLPDRVGVYRLLHELGRGGQAVVWLAEDNRIQRKVALKLLPTLGPGSEAVLRRFRREAEVTSRLEHPAICPIYEADIEGGVPFIAMRFVDGETLAKRVQRAGEPTDPKAWATYFAKAARALEVAHQAGVLHRDIKPANLMVTPAGEPVILDFGLARQDGEEVGLSRSGENSGTPTYMSPEQMLGRGALDRRADVYSLGCTLFECLTGRPPFVAPTLEGLLTAVLREEVTDVRRLRSELPADLAVIVATATAKDRERRYRTAADMAEDLERFGRDEPILARPVTRWQRFARWTRRNPALAASLGLASLLLLTAAAALAYGIGAGGRAALAAQLREQADRDRERVESEQARTAQATADRQLAAKLDEIIMRQGTLLYGVPGGRAAVPSLLPTYEAAFRGVGLDFTAPPSVAAGHSLLRRLQADDRQAVTSVRWALGNLQGLLAAAGAERRDERERVRQVLAPFADPALAPYEDAIGVWYREARDEFESLLAPEKLGALSADQLVEVSGLLQGVPARADLSLQLLDRALVQQPDSFAVNFQRAGLAMGMGWNAELPAMSVKAAQTAVEHARAAVALRPRSGLARALLSGALAMRTFRSNDPTGYEASWQMMESATACEPENGLVWFLRADYLRRVPGASDGAKAACKKALELEPGLLPAQSLLTELGG